MAIGFYAAIKMSSINVPMIEILLAAVIFFAVCAAVKETNDMIDEEMQKLYAFAYVNLAILADSREVDLKDCLLDFYKTRAEDFIEFVGEKERK